MIIFFFFFKNKILNERVKCKTDKDGAALVEGCDGHGSGNN